MTDQTSQETEQRETLQHAMDLFEDNEGLVLSLWNHYSNAVSDLATT